ncbi:MAG: MarR family transcriptional regulator [Cyclobacteriaceae bacterium]|nr:MarR family transcriptional regulator [Cyclobacteriaceae bacterium]
MEQPESLQDNIIYQIGEVDKIIRDNVLTIFKENGHDISPEQFTILVVLWYLDGLTQNTIAATVNRDKTTISRVLDRMVKNGLILRGKGKEDKRERKIFITKKGKKVQEKLIEKTNVVYHRALMNITDEEINIANRVLNTIFKNLQKESL